MKTFCMLLAALAGLGWLLTRLEGCYPKPPGPAVNCATDPYQPGCAAPLNDDNVIPLDAKRKTDGGTR